MVRVSRRIWWVAGVVLSAAVAVVALRPRPIAVETARATRGPFAATVIAEGRTRVKALYVVATPVDGELERISLEAGDPIEPSAVIARVWPAAPRPLDIRSRAEATAGVAAARAAVTRADAAEEEAAAALVHAESAYSTAKTLARSGAGTDKDAEHAGHEVEIRRKALVGAQAAARASRADLDRAEARVGSGGTRSAGSATAIASPIAGRVLRILRESAGIVMAGTPLAELGDTTDLEVTADLLTADALTVQPGAEATLRDWGSNEPAHARVRRIDPAAFTKVSPLGLEEQRVRVVMDLIDPRPAGLGHDFRVTAAIATWTGQDVLTIPSSALFRAGDRWAVFVVRDGRVQQTIVTPGRTDGTRTVVDQGLAAGDEVVTQPSDTLRDGARVGPRRGGSEPGR